VKHTNIAILATLGIVALVIFLPALASFAHVPGWSPAHESLPAIMGAIFTAGGLVIAMVSVLTFMQIDRTIAEAVTKSLTSVRAEMEERSQTYFLAFSNFRLAQDAWIKNQCASLDYIREGLERADELEPPLLESRVFGGETFLRAARAAYLKSQIRINLIATYTPPFEDVPRLSAYAMPRLDFAMEVLTKKGDKRKYPLLIAECQALLGENATRISQTLTANRTDNGLDPISPQGLIALFASCKTPSDVTRIVAAAGLSLMTREEVLTRLKAAPAGEAVSFVVFAAKPSELQKPRTGAFQAFFKTTDHLETAILEWLSYPNETVTPPAGLPEWITTGGVVQSPTPKPIDTLLGEAFDKLIFIAPLPWNYDIWYLP
jgi:hypothetical protein